MGRAAQEERTADLLRLENLYKIIVSINLVLSLFSELWDWVFLATFLLGDLPGAVIKGYLEHTFWKKPQELEDIAQSSHPITSCAQKLVFKCLSLLD